mmetsp:Transcript_66775/g.204364  ORF Transcript_66775/g.204364 Transcript_66775/m.204364 type:complete len:202 (-) Transcript_66775:1609-2214(-)
MESLSYVWSDFKKSDSLTIFFEGPHQSSTILPVSSLTRAGLMPFMMHTACNTNFTGPGGLPMALISPMSLAVKVSKAARAFCNAGIASAKSASTSAFCASDLAADSAATASSAATTSFTLFVFSDSALTFTIISSTSVFLATSFGCSAISSTFIPATDSSVVKIFSTPFWYLSFKSATCFRFSAKSILNVWINSKKEVGVA